MGDGRWEMERNRVLGDRIEEYREKARKKAADGVVVPVNKFKFLSSIASNATGASMDKGKISKRKYRGRVGAVQCSAVQSSEWWWLVVGGWWWVVVVVVADVL